MKHRLSLLGLVVPYALCRPRRGIYLASTPLLSKSSNNFVRKFLINNNETKKRRKWHQSRMTMMANPSELSQPQAKGEGDSHRLHVLNKVFMDKICDILSTGEISSLFGGYGLEISKVRVLPSMSGINVHWFCTGLHVDDNLEKILIENSHALRHELSQQRVIGRVPPIRFVKDHRYYKLMEVEKRLGVADFGEDFEPTDPSHHVKSSIVMRTEFDDGIKNALRVPEDEEPPDIFVRAIGLASLQSSEPREPLPDDLPPMRSDVLGIDTQNIYNMVRQGMTRTRAEHRKNSEEPQTRSTLLSELDTGTQSFPSRTEEIRQWANKYEQLRKKERRSKNREYELLSLPPVYIEEDFEEIVYQEEEDFLDENLELNKHDEKVV